MFLLLVVITHLCSIYAQSPSKLIYWELKPYIYKMNNSLAGILPDMFKSMDIYCSHGWLDWVNAHASPSFKEFKNLLSSNISYGEGILSNITANNVLWAPYFDKDIFKASFEQRRSKTPLRMLRFTVSGGLAVIVKTEKIKLFRKVLDGTLRCWPLLVLNVVCCTNFGVLLWLAERHTEQFTDTFIPGAEKGVWWSIVTMTTVGYGDVVPRTFIGRIIAITWIFFGIIIGAIITATVTETVSGAVLWQW